MSDQFYPNYFDEPELDGITSLWYGALHGGEWDTTELLYGITHPNPTIRIDSANALSDALGSMTREELRRVIEQVSYALLNETHHEVSPALIALLQSARKTLRATNQS